MNEDHEREHEIEPSQGGATIKLDLEPKSLQAINESLMYLSLGLSCALVILWSIAKRIDDLEVALVKYLGKTL